MKKFYVFLLIVITCISTYAGGDSCQHCHSSVNADQNFCTECGKPTQRLATLHDNITADSHTLQEFPDGTRIKFKRNEVNYSYPLMGGGNNHTPYVITNHEQLKIFLKEGKGNLFLVDGTASHGGRKIEPGVVFSTGALTHGEPIITISTNYRANLPVGKLGDFLQLADPPLSEGAFKSANIIAATYKSLLHKGEI